MDDVRLTRLRSQLDTIRATDPRRYIDLEDAAKALRVYRHARSHAIRVRHGVGLGYLLQVARADGLDLTDDTTLALLLIVAEMLASVVEGA